MKKDTQPQTRCPRKPLSKVSFSVDKYNPNSGNCQVERYFWIILAVLVAALIAGQLWT